MIAVDANLLSVLLYPNCQCHDFKTVGPIPRAIERVEYLIEQADISKENIIVPYPALGEAMVVAGPDAPLYLQRIHSFSCFLPKAFGEAAIIENAIRTRTAMDNGGKRIGTLDGAPWQKIKVDRQVVAIAIAEGAKAMYSTDEDIHKICLDWGLPVYSISEIALPATQLALPQGENEKDSKADINP